MRVARWLVFFVGLAAIFGLFCFLNSAIRTTVLLGLPILIMLSGLWEGRKGIVIFSSISLLMVGILWLAEVFGKVQVAFSDSLPLIFYIVVCVFIVFISAIQWKTINNQDGAKDQGIIELTGPGQDKSVLHENREFRMRVFDNSRMPVVIMELATYEYIDCNLAAVQIYGLHARENIIGKTPLDVSPHTQPDGTPSMQKAQEYVKRALNDGSVKFEWRHQRPGGELWDAEVHLMRFASGTSHHLQFTIQDITERKKAEQALRRTSDHLSTLIEVGRAVSNHRHLPSLLETIYDEAIRILPLDFFFICLYDHQTRQISFPIMFDNGQPISQPPQLLSETSFSGKTILSGEPLLLNQWADTDVSPATIVGDPTTITASLMFAPLQVNERALGVISAQSYHINAFDEDDLSLLSGIARQVAIAIENARLFTDLQKELDERQRAEELMSKVNFELQWRIKELSLLNSVAQAGASALDEYELLDAVVDILYRSLYPDIVAIAFWDEQDQVLRTHSRAHRGMSEHIGKSRMTTRLNEGVVGRVAATRRPYRVRNVDDPIYYSISPEIYSELCVPILAGERLIGVLDIESKQIDAFSDSDENLLATIAGQLASALERLRAENLLRNLNAELEKRVMERTTQLEAANRELESFSYSISHDLRAPLRAINGFAKIIEDDFAHELSPEAREFLEKIRASGTKMAQLIDALLDFSRISRRPLNRQEVDPGVLARETIESLAADTASRQIEWKLSEMPCITVDPILFQQVYANLIGNAVKYTSKRNTAQIELGSQIQDGERVYFVRDNGAGFNMQYADKLFGVFQRLHRDEEFEGTGIGLATVKRIIERHAGRIWAESEADKGTTFYFSLGKESF